MSNQPPFIMIVDDDYLIREYLEGLFTILDYRTVSAHNGESALKLLETNKPDLVLCDIRMMGMDGFTLSSSIKSNPETEDIIVILMSALSGTPEEREAAAKAKANDFINRSMPSDDLVAYIENWLYPSN